MPYESSVQEKLLAAVVVSKLKHTNVVHFTTNLVFAFIGVDSKRGVSIFESLMSSRIDLIRHYRSVWDAIIVSCKSNNFTKCHSCTVWKSEKVFSLWAYKMKEL